MPADSPKIEMIPKIEIAKPGSPTMQRRGASSKSPPLHELQRRMETGSSSISMRKRETSSGSGSGSTNFGNIGVCLMVGVLLFAGYIYSQQPLTAKRTAMPATSGSLAIDALEPEWMAARRLMMLNVLYVVLEDFGTLGSSVFAAPGGAPNGTTPNLQRLAARGVVFRHAYCQAPICNPSRSSLLVGRRPSHTRIYTNEDRYDVHMPANTPTLVDFLRFSDRRAIVACGGGKLFHEACDSAPRGFSRCGAACSGGGGGSQGGAVNAVGAATRVDTGLSNDQQKVNDTIAMLHLYQSNRSRFFLGVGLSSTHVMRPAGLCSYRAAKMAGLDGSGSTDLALPPRRSSERRAPLVTWPSYDLKADSRMSLRKRGMTPSESRMATAAYFACASHVDAQIGRLLDALDDLRLSRSTAVIVHADHGFSLGRHGRWSKYSLFEEAARVPLVVSLPGMRTANAVDDIVEAVDILPTLLDLWGVPHGELDRGDGTEEPTSSYHLGEAGGRSRSVRLDGRSLLPFLEEAGRVEEAVLAQRAQTAAQMAPTQQSRRRTPSETRRLDSQLQEEMESSLYLGGQRHQPAGHSGARVISIGGNWPKWYARAELHETYRRNQFDGPVAGAGPADTVWPGAQLWIRTVRFAYTAYFELFPQNQTWPTFASSAALDNADPTDPLHAGGSATAFALGSFRLVDETLYDTGGTDPEESNNLAYDVAHKAQRDRLLDLCLRDWSVRLKGPRDATRGQRLAYLKTTSTGRKARTPA